MPKVRSKNAMVVVVGKKGRRRVGRNKGQNVGMSAGTGGGISKMLFQEYYKSLINPFECSGCYLGWGCMVPSTIATGYLRTIGVTGSDGTLAMFAIPTCGSATLYTNNNTVNVASWGSFALSNSTAINANFTEGRPISLGVRAFPAVAATSVPGAVSTGAIVANNVTTLTSLSAQDLINMPSSHMSIGLAGGSSTGRPIDPDSFTFNALSIGSLLVGTPLNFSVPYIVFTGLPASTTCFIEVVFNFEGTQVIGHNTQTVVPADSNNKPTLSDYFVNYETMNKNVAPMLPPPGRPGESTASSDVSFLDALWAGAKGLLRGAASTFGGKFGGAVANALLPPTTQRPLINYYQGSGQTLPRGISGYLQ